MRSDNDLLLDYARNGSEAAFAELVERHIALVYSAALRVLVDAHLAQDVTQTTFAILAQKARFLSGHAAISSWLHRTASNQAAKLVRGEMRRRAREQEVYVMQTLRADTEPDWKQLAPILDAALNTLPETDRSALFLRFFEKKSALEIGVALKLGEQAAQKRVQRALERLRKHLSKGGLTISSTTLTALITAQAVVAAPAGLSASVCTSALAFTATAGGITLTTLKLLFMSKIKISIVSAAIVAVVATPLVVQRQNLTRLRHENEQLTQQIASTRELRVESDELARQLDEARRTRELSNSRLSELLRLRGEVGPLRRDSQELARLRSKQAAAPGAPMAAGFVPAAAWANVGADKPEAAIETFLWAGKQGETNLVGNLLRWQRDADIPASAELDQKFAGTMIKGTTRMAGDLQGFRVTSKQEAATNEVRLEVEMTNPDGKSETHNLRLVQEDGQWFPVIHVWLQEQGSVHASMDTPPKFRQGK